MLFLFLLPLYFTFFFPPCICVGQGLQCHCYVYKYYVRIELQESFQTLKRKSQFYITFSSPRYTTLHCGTYCVTRGCPKSTSHTEWATRWVHSVRHFCQTVLQERGGYAMPSSFQRLWSALSPSAKVLVNVFGEEESWAQRTMCRGTVEAALVAEKA